MDGCVHESIYASIEKNGADMIFDGDLSKYHPADALMFLSHLGLNGVLSIAHDDAIITLSIKEGHLLDAQSSRGDQKILRCLWHQGLIDKARHRHVLRVQAETGIPVRQILGELNFIALDAAKPYLEIGVQDVLLELFLLEKGTFHFTDEEVGYDEAHLKFAIHPITIKISTQTDEFREFEKTVRSLDHPLGLTPSAEQIKEPSGPEQAIFKLAAENTTIAQTIEQAPMASYEAMKIIQNLLEQGFLKLASDTQTAPLNPSGTSLDPAFLSYKRSLKKLIKAEDVLKKLEAMLSFCKDFYDGILILTSKGPDIVYCKLITIDSERGIRQRSLNGQFGKIDADPVFQAVSRSGVGFFGKIFPSDLLNNMIDLVPDGECALIPFQSRPGMSLFLYPYTSRAFAGLSPHHYLELLSWMVTPTDVKAANTDHDEEIADQKGTEESKPLVAAPQRPSITHADAIVQKIKDLPPLPSLVTKALTMLSDPTIDLTEVETVIGQDQALVAKLIKVSNSVLYGRVQKVSTLRQALARLGAKIVKSLILSTATRSYFLKRGSGTNAWGQFLWQHTVECGLAARRIAESFDDQDPEEAFIGGIIHDIGKLAILLVYPDKYKAIQKTVRTENIGDIQAETNLLGCSHAEIGYLLLDQWKMPDTAKASARFHHNFEDAGEYRILAAIIAYGNYFSHTFGAQPQMACAEIGETTNPALALNISEERQADLREAILADYARADLIG